jgi:TolB-like protein/class 3 adenylate cyclase
MSEVRKLAAILASDVVGYGRLAGADEDRILARLRALRSDVIDPTIALHKGRVVERTGDGAIVEFRSVVEAVRCAIEVQSAMIECNAGLPGDKRIVFRIGVHLGDVVEEADGDLMGDGVNIAARLQGVAEPGGICLSEDAYRQVKARPDLAFKDLGRVQLKNIAEAVRVFAVETEFSAHPKSPLSREHEAAAARPTAPALPDEPSIAVLPFQNMSGDAEQEYFADGIVEDIITALSRFKQLFVIARNSSFAYKERAVDVKQVGRELGVRYVLEGSVRRSADRVRITGQLIDASTGSHIWADRFDGELNNIFQLQDHVTAMVVGAIAPKLQRAEIDRAQRKPPENLHAYDYYLRGMANLHQWTRASTDESLRLFYKAVELDRDYASAYGMAAFCFVLRKSNVWLTDRSAEIKEGGRLARLAVDLGPDDPVALATGGYALAFVGHDLDAGAAFLDRALALNPNLASAPLSSGWVKTFRAEPDAAIEQLTYVMRLSPLDPHIFRAQGGIALAHILAGRNDEAKMYAEMALKHRPTYLPALRELAAANGLAGRLDEARQAIDELRRLHPSLRVSTVKDWVPFRRGEDLARLEQGLRKAGLPE